MPTTLLERFERSYIPEPNSGCWIWLGHEHKVTGYGRIREDSKPHGKHLLAHRASWVLHRGAIPDGLLVCHTCDNRSCVNPDHLFLGTHGDNNRDAARKGRSRWKNRDRVPNLRRGARHPMAKLTETEIRAIREASGSGKEIGRLFGISDTHVYRIKGRTIWKDLA